MPPADQKADFVVITALPEERDAVLAKFGPVAPVAARPSDPNVYYRARFGAGQGIARPAYRVVVTSLLGMGRVQAALSTSDAIRRWQPDYVMLVGIAGGFRAVRSDLKLGDVLIADEIIDYELQKVQPRGAQIRDKRPPISVRLLTAAQNFTGEWCSALTESRPSGGRPKVLFGPVATGDKVLNDQTTIGKLVKRFPRLIGVEMEAGGAASAALRNETNFFMVRGVSDFADGTKNTAATARWRKYACDVAATFAAELVRSGLLPPRSARHRDASNAEVSQMVASTTRAVAVLDCVSEDVASLVTDEPLPPTPRRHTAEIDGSGIELVVRHHGQVSQTLTAADLNRLPRDLLRYITVLEKSLEKQFAVWEEVRPQLATMGDPVAKARVRQELREIAKNMEGDLAKLLDTLKSAGFYLSDHYLHLRSVIAKPD